MASVKFRGFEYEIPSEFTNREMIAIEQISGKSAVEISQGVKTGRLTWGAMCGIAHAAMTRAGTTIDLDDLLDADMGAVEFVGDKPEPEATPGPLDVSVEPSPPVSPSVEPAATTVTHVLDGNQS